jgi:signal peptidase I
MANVHRNKWLGILHDHVKPFAFVVLILCMVRSSIADWNDVPTGSMNPSILEGDRIFVNKLAYDLKVPFTTWHIAEWSQPSRGDVVVFYSPTDGTRMVKRVVGMPGDLISLEDNHLFVNGQPAQYGPADPAFSAAMGTRAPGGQIASETVNGRSHPVMQLPRRPGMRDFAPYVVPEGQYFMMGDNRDNSSDSRYWGTVERSRIVGRASGVAISLDPDKSYKPRWQRFFTSLP